MLNNCFVPHNLLVAFSVHKFEPYSHKHLFVEQWVESWLVAIHMWEKCYMVTKKAEWTNLTQNRSEGDTQKQHKGTKTVSILPY